MVDMKPIRFSSHAEGNLIDRDIPQAEVVLAVRSPQRREPGRPPRYVVSRVYVDAATGEAMLLRVFIEETADEIAVVTVYKTSKLRKYLPGTL